MDDRNPPALQPGDEGAAGDQRLRRLEAAQRELHYFGGGLFDQWQPGAGTVEARDMNTEARGIEPLDELGHLPLGAAGMKRRHDDSDRQRLGGHACG